MSLYPNSLYYNLGDVQNAFIRHTLPHGILFYHTELLFLSDATHKLAKWILCLAKIDNLACDNCRSCQLFMHGVHPDLYRIASDAGSAIKVLEIRESIEFLMSAAQISNVKMLIIEAADLMNESAANALLKQLEEPALCTYILLLTTKPKKLPCTILSRVQQLNLGNASVNLDDYVTIMHQDLIAMQSGSISVPAVAEKWLQARNTDLSKLMWELAVFSLKEQFGLLDDLKARSVQHFKNIKYCESQYRKWWIFYEQATELLRLQQTGINLNLELQVSNILLGVL